MAKVQSGTFWIAWANTNARNSTSVDDLVEPFKTNVKTFIKALQNAGATVDVMATLRSDKRAYLFHWCWLIGLGKAKAATADTMAGVDIEWNHGDDQKSQAGAKEMIVGFNLAVPPSSTNPPALHTNHSFGKAIDMEITWKGTINVKQHDGTLQPVTFLADVNQNLKLHAIGATYGVMKLTTDAPHWSIDGH